MHVVVAGCGWLGQAVATALVGRGDRVTGVRRDRAAAARLAALGISPLVLDLAAPGAAERLPGDADAIVACQSAGGDSVEAYRAAYLGVTGELLAGARRRRLRAFVYTSSTGVFGQRDGSDVDEATAPAPAGATAEVLAEAERMVLEAARELPSPVPARVLRLSGLYGPGRTFAIDRVRSGAMALGPGDDAWTNWCHRDDAAAAVLAVMARGRDGAVYHGTDAEPARRREVVQWIADRLGMAPPRQERRAAPGPHRRVLGERTRAELGLRLAFPTFREGLEPLLPRHAGE